MDRLRSFSLGELVYTVWINGVQDIIAAVRPSTVGDLSAMSGGVEGRIWQATADLATGTLIEVDPTAIKVVDNGVSPAVLVSSSTFVWYDRIVCGYYRGFAGANQRVGQVNDYQFDAAGAPTTFLGYLGKGAKDAGSNPPSAGNPPVRASGSSWAAEIVANLWLYADPVNGKLYLYNDTGATIRTPFLWLSATAPTGKRP